MTALRRCFGCASPERKEGKQKARSPQNPIAQKQQVVAPVKYPRVGLPWEFPHMPIRLFVLRHEQRGPDPTFHSALTPTGYQGAKRLAETLKGLPIHSVFSSPFLRTLQTVAPYCARGKISVHLEFALYELLADPSHSKFGVLGAEDIDRTRVRIPIDPDYASVVPQNELRLSEGLRDVQYRVARFLQRLLSVYDDEFTNTQNDEGFTDGFTSNVSTSAYPTTSTFANQHSTHHMSSSTRHGCFPQHPANPSSPVSSTPVLPMGVDESGGTWNILLVSHMHVVNSILQLQDPMYGLNTHYSSGELTEVDVERVRAGLRGYLRQVHEASASRRRSGGANTTSAMQTSFV